MKTKKVKAPKVAIPEKIKVADQRKVTVYYPPAELDQMNQAVFTQNRFNVKKIKYARILYALGHLWRKDEELQKKVREYLGSN